MDPYENWHKYYIGYLSKYIQRSREVILYYRADEHAGKSFSKIKKKPLMLQPDFMEKVQSHPIVPLYIIL